MIKMLLEKIKDVELEIETLEKIVNSNKVNDDVFKVINSRINHYNSIICGLEIAIGAIARYNMPLRIDKKGCVDNVND